MITHFQEYLTHPPNIRVDTQVSANIVLLNIDKAKHICKNYPILYEEKFNINKWFMHVTKKKINLIEGKTIIKLSRKESGQKAKQVNQLL